MNSLAAIGAATKNEGLGTGTTEVWYMRPSFFRDGCMGPEWLEEHKMLPTAATLETTHVCLGTVDREHPEAVWALMQGECWSPKGEANGFICGLGLKHTSMSVGDIVRKGDDLYMVDGCGFRKL